MIGKSVGKGVRLCVFSRCHRYPCVAGAMHYSVSSAAPVVDMSLCLLVGTFFGIIRASRGRTSKTRAPLFQDLI